VFGTENTTNGVDYFTSVNRSFSKALNLVVATTPGGGGEIPTHLITSFSPEPQQVKSHFFWNAFFALGQ
jgi:hypothetical protein